VRSTAFALLGTSMLAIALHSLRILLAVLTG
jgi:hypothetical protein